MGPNLEKLFSDTRSRIRRVDRSYYKLQMLFDRHGEALIEALEMLLENYENVVIMNNKSYDSAMVSARTILAQLEAETQP